MADVPLLTVANASKVGVRYVPQRTGQVFFPILNAVAVFVSGVFSPSRVGLPGVEYTVEVGVLIAVIEGVAVGVVVSWVACLSRIAVGAVDFDPVADAVVVRVRGCRVGEQGEGFIGVVQAVTVGVGTNGTGRCHAVHLSRVGGTTAGSDSLNGVTRRSRLGDDAVWTVAETRR